MILKIICIIFVTGTVGVFADQTIPFDDDGVKKQCNTICSSNRSEYVPENGVCRCFLDQQIDNTELLFMSKNANLLGLSLEIITPDNGIITVQPKILTTNTEITTNEPLITTTIDDNSDEMVAQSQMQPPRLYHHHHHRPLQPITQDQQQLLLQQIRDRLNRLSLTTDPKIRQAELHGIRMTLRQLSRSSLLQRPQIRPRIAPDQLRNMMGQARIQTRMRLASNRLGAAAPKINNTNEEIIVETTPMELEDFSITTQPSELLQEGE